MAKKLLAPDGSPLLFQGKEIFEASYGGVVKQVNVEGRTMSMVGTDESVDRDGDIIRLSGWNLDNYKDKNPVFLWAHNYGSVPIASADKVVKRREPPRMEFSLRFPTKGIYPFADMILELYGEKIINASSVGFLPIEWKDMERPPESNETDGVRSRRTWGREYLKQELLELSGCAVPSNPNALQSALTGKSFGFKPEEMLKWLTGDTLIPRPEKADDIMEEMRKRTPEMEDETTSPMVQVPATFEMAPSEDVETLTIKQSQIALEEVIKLEEVLKPYPGEHACRLKDPGKFERFARKNCFRKHDGKCVDYIFGFPKGGGGETQAMRYKKDSWTAAAAKSHCSSHKGSFEAAATDEVAPEEIKSSSIKIMVDEERLKSIESKLESIGQTLESMVNQLKDFLVSQTKVNDKDLKESETSVSSVILGEAFSQGKSKLSPEVPMGLNPEDIKNLKQALIDLKEVTKSFKISS